MTDQDSNRDQPIEPPGGTPENGALSDTLYSELRALAGHYLRMERVGHTLQPTALVSEAYLRMRDRLGEAKNNRRDFVALAASIMRRVLVDHARATKAAKRGGGRARVDMEGADVGAQQSMDLLALDETIEKLAQLDPRLARVVELRFFGGLSVAQTAEILEVSDRTVEADWHLARAWLRRKLNEAESDRAPGHPRGEGRA